MQSQLVPKRMRVADYRQGSHRGRTCGNCGKVHEGGCRPSSGCHKCGKEGHIARDCRHQTPAARVRLCYHCDQVGHMKAQCPLLAVRPVQAPELATLRLTDRGQGRAEPLKAPGHAYQLVTEEIRSAPEVSAGMFLCLLLFML